MIEIELADGTVLEFPEGTPDDVIDRVAKQETQARIAPPQPNTNLGEQAGAGFTEGLASLFGIPSDLSNASSDLITRGINRVTGLDLKTARDLEEKSGPLLGTSDRYVQDAQTLGVMTEAPPQTGAQEFLRGTTRELGSSLPVSGLAAARGAVSGGKMLIAELLASIGGQAGATMAQDSSPAVQEIARLAGNVAGGSMVGLTPGRRPQTPSYDDVDSLANRSWAAVEGSDMRLTPQGRDDFITRLDDRFRTGRLSERASERNTPKAVGALDDAATLPAAPHIYGDIVDYRRAVSRNVAGALDPSERRLGVGMKQEIDDYLRNIQPSQATGSDVDGTVDALRTANDASRRVANADLIMDQLDKAGRRAARSGRGGNTINTVRQNIDKILNSRTLRAGFSDDEIRMMESIVSGTPTANALRWVAGLAPSTGVLPAMGNLAAGAGAAATGNPLLMLPGIAGEAAKAIADGMTQRQVRELIARTLNGAPLPAREPRNLQAIISALVAGQAGYANTPQGNPGPR